MLIETPLVQHSVTEYDFTFSSGVVMPITINSVAGDFVDWSDPQVIVVNLKAKPALSDPSKTLPSEKITLHRAHLIVIQERERVITELSPDQKLEMGDFIKSLSTSIH